MKFKTKQTIFSALAFIIILGGTLLAGSLIPTGPVGTPTMYTLSDIYNKLNLNTYTTTAGNHSISTTSLPTTGTMHTLTEIWNSIPTISASTIATGTTIMGIAGTNPAYAYGSSSASGVLYSTALGAGTANDPAGATEGRVVASASGDVMSGKFAFSTDGTIINGTGSAGSPALQWSADDPTGHVDWATAGAYCSVTLGNGYRLPTYVELVAKYLATNPGNTAGFQSDYYWSSTEYPRNSGSAYFVNMGIAYASSLGKTYPNSYARCVR
jgi:hypothetical protein